MIRKAFKQIWFESAANLLRAIISYYEHFQHDGFMKKIMGIRQHLVDTEDNEALTMTIAMYKPKLENRTFRSTSMNKEQMIYDINCC